MSDMGIFGESNEGYESRMSIVNEIMEALRDPNVRMIGLCGAGGVGKTTTVKEVARKVKGEVFETMVMVEVTDCPDLKKIQREIAEKVGMILYQETENVRASRLHERLKREKNMLLILDDLWEKLEFSKIGIPSDSRVLLTSRMDSLLSIEMECQKVIKVGVMSEDEAWKLFTMEIAELPNDCKILSIAKEIVQLCGGLPIRIVAAAGTLKNKGVDEWKDVLQQLKSPLQRNNTGIEKADDILRICYDRLSQESKPIFLLSAMLSHNPMIEDLMMYSVGLGLLQGVHTMEGALVRIHSLINQLKVSNLLLNVSYNSRFTIHDVIRDFTLSIASSEEHALVVRHDRLNRWLDKNLRKQYRGMCIKISDINDLPEVLSCPKLQFFILNSKNSNLSIPSTLFQSMSELKVMGFTNVHFLRFPYLQSLQKELQTLSLHSCVLEDIAEVGNLKSLTFLSLACSNIKQLPRELSRLTSLKMLNLAHCYKLKVIPAKLLSSLKRLEVLDMGDSFDQWEAKGDSKGNGNASLDELKHLRNLTSLKVGIPDVSVFPKNLFKDIPLERYIIRIGYSFLSRRWPDEYRLTLNISGIYLDDGIQKLLENVEELCLIGKLKGNTKVFCDFHGRRFLKLKLLMIQYNDQLDYAVRNSTSAVQSFCELVEIDIKECNSMKAFVVSNQQSLVSNNIIVFHQLRTLSMTALSMLWTFYLEENATNNECNKEFKSLFSCKVSFPMLETMKLWSLNSLISSIWDDQLPQHSFANLKKLSVRNCGFVQRLIPFHVLKSLSNLEELEVGLCESLEMVFDFEELNNYNNEIQLSWAVPLRKLQLFKLPKLKHVWGNNPQETKLFHEKVFHKLEMLELDGKHAMMIWKAQFPDNLFQTVQELSLKLDGSEDLMLHGLHINRFPNLQNLRLSGCVKELIISPRNDVPPFKTLVLNEVHKLKHIWNERSRRLDFVLQHLQNLRVHLCHDLISLGPSFISLANLKDIEVRACHGLTNLMVSSTFRSLVQLTRLSISFCIHMEEIITKQQQGEGENDVEKEIVSDKLKSLTLESLSNLRSFCSHNYTFWFPSLEEVIIRDCGRMSKFCPGDIHTPSLKCMTFRKYPDENEEKLLDNNLNKTIQQCLLTQVTILELYPEMRNMWMEKPPHHMPLSRLEHLIVDNCDFLSDYVIPTHLVRSLSNLKVLEVRNCHALKTIFDLKGTNLDEELHNSLANIRLKRLKLHHLPKLKCVWIQDLDGSNCFQWLEGLYVDECESLRNIFLASAVEGLGQLKELSIISCGVEVIIAKDETLKESPNFVFPQLSYLKLDKLHNLKCFYPERCTFQWPQLIDLSVSHCENLKVFGTEMTIITQSREEDEVETQLPPFLAEKVIPTLKSLSLSQKDETIIRSSQFQGEVFHEVGRLYLESFVGESIAFPHNFLERFPNLYALIVNHCSFKEIFPSHVQHVDDMRQLSLANLDQLKTIWNDDVDSHQLQPLHQNLRRLEVECCCHLIKLTPSSASFENLNHLKVSGCQKLTYLVTNSTAKSLVNLRWLVIKDCEKMEEIVTNENNDAEDEITFNYLCGMELTNLPILKSFCSKNQSFKFPRLCILTIMECHQMKMFCHGVLETPELRSLETEEGITPLEGDLNKTIELFISEKLDCDTISSNDMAAEVATKEKNDMKRELAQRNT